jgi:hypothetical protein
VGAIDVLNPEKPKRVLMLASNSAVSEQTGWPIGFWWAELTHPYWEFVDHGTRLTSPAPRAASSKATSSLTPATRASIRRTT